MIYNDISLALRNKIRQDLCLVSTNHHDMYHDAELVFNHNESHLYEECKEWRSVIDKYYRTTYDAYSITKVGRFHRVRPEKIDQHSVLFSVGHFDAESWLDWFDVEGKSDGVLKGTVGTVINKRTHPQYAPFKFT